MLTRNAILRYCYVLILTRFYSFLKLYDFDERKEKKQKQKQYITFIMSSSERKKRIRTLGPSLKQTLNHLTILE